MLEHKWSMFLVLMRWAEGGSCRHDAILRYFGDEAETLAGCGRCDVCLRLEAGDQGADPEAVSTTVRKALSAVARIHGRFGLGAAAKLLRGAEDPRLARAGLDRTRTTERSPSIPRSGCCACFGGASRLAGRTSGAAIAPSSC